MNVNYNLPVYDGKILVFPNTENATDRRILSPIFETSTSAEFVASLQKDIFCITQKVVENLSNFDVPKSLEASVQVEYEVYSAHKIKEANSFFKKLFLSFSLSDGYEKFGELYGVCFQLNSFIGHSWMKIAPIGGSREKKDFKFVECSYQSKNTIFEKVLNDVIPEFGTIVQRYAPNEIAVRIDSKVPTLQGYIKEK